MKITLIYRINKSFDVRKEAGRGSVGRLIQLFAAPAGRPAEAFPVFVDQDKNWFLRLIPGQHCKYHTFM